MFFISVPECHSCGLVLCGSKITPSVNEFIQTYDEKKNKTEANRSLTLITQGPDDIMWPNWRAGSGRT